MGTGLRTNRAADTLDARDVVARRGDLFALRLDALSLAPGEALMLAGPNGAGKSTLLRLLAGLLPRAEGRLSFDGRDPREDIRAYAARLQFMGHKDAVKNAFTVRETLRHWMHVQGLVGDALGALTAFGLGALADLPVGYLSAGQRRRLALTRLVAVPRSLWLLDEPASSLDAEGRAALSAVIADHRRRGGLVVMASHGELALPDARMLTLGSGA